MYNVYKKFTSKFGLISFINCSSSIRSSKGSNVLIDNVFSSGCNIYIPFPFISLVLKL